MTSKNQRNLGFAILDRRRTVVAINVGIATMHPDETQYKQIFFKKENNLYAGVSTSSLNFSSDEFSERGIEEIRITLPQNSIVGNETTQNEIIIDMFAIKILDDRSNIIPYNWENIPNNANNYPSSNYTYDSHLNAFIPPKEDETYILNESTYQWEPDPNLTYDLHGDGKLYQYQPESKSWIPTWDPEPEESP